MSEEKTSQEGSPSSYVATYSLVRVLIPSNTLVSQARPNQPLRGSLSVSPCMILKAIRAGVGWVWLARLQSHIHKLCSKICSFPLPEIVLAGPNWRIRQNVPRPVTLQRAPLRSSLTSHRARLSHEKLSTKTMHFTFMFFVPNEWQVFHFVNVQDSSAWMLGYTLQEKTSR